MYVNEKGKVITDKYDKVILKIEKQRDALVRKLLSDEKENDYPYKRVELLSHPFDEKVGELYRKQRMEIPIVLRDEIDADDDVMTLEDFRKAVDVGFFIDNDGFGCYIKDGRKTNIHIYPSDFEYGAIREGFTEIAWFNK